MKTLEIINALAGTVGDIVRVSDNKATDLTNVGHAKYVPKSRYKKQQKAQQVIEKQKEQGIPVITVGPPQGQSVDAKKKIKSGKKSNK